MSQLSGDSLGLHVLQLLIMPFSLSKCPGWNKNYMATLCISQGYMGISKIFYNFFYSNKSFKKLNSRN